MNFLSFCFFVNVFLLPLFKKITPWRHIFISCNTLFPSVQCHSALVVLVSCAAITTSNVYTILVTLCPSCLSFAVNPHILPHPYSLPQANTDFCPNSFSFLDVLWKWSHTICDLLCLLSVNRRFLRFVHVITCPSSSLFLIAE